jgi:hypothetical protein
VAGRGGQPRTRSEFHASFGRCQTVPRLSKPIQGFFGKRIVFYGRLPYGRSSGVKPRSRGVKLGQAQSSSLAGKKDCLFSHEHLPPPLGLHATRRNESHARRTVLPAVAAAKLTHMQTKSWPKPAKIFLRSALPLIHRHRPAGLSRLTRWLIGLSDKTWPNRQRGW